jgi:hypothetical protein
MKYCCDEMKSRAEHKCELHDSPFDCADNLIYHSSDNEFGLIIHDGGCSYIIINYCPFCGKKL